MNLPAGPFVPLSAAHWAVLVAIGGAAVVLSWLLRRTAGKRHARVWRRAICWTLALVLAGGFLVAELQRVLEGSWTLQESLPLHLCDIAIFVTAAALIAAGLARPGGGLGQRCYELSWVWAIGGTSQAVLTPDLAVTFPHAECVRYFLLHGTIIVSALVLTFGLRMRPQPGTPVRVWVATFSLAVVVLLVDWATGANYMYLCGPPKHPSLIDCFGKWPWSLLTLAVAATLLIVLTYAPFWVSDRLRRRTARQEARPPDPGPPAARREPRPP
jgi:hypothetical integral membrane protein (TIGR02206 family)